MAEPLSIATSATGLVSFGLQVSQSLVNFYTSYRDQSADIERTINRLEGLSTVLQSLDNAVKERKFKPGEHRLKESVEQSIESCEDQIEELQEEFQKFDKASGKGLAASIKRTGYRITYPFRDSTLKKLDEDVGEIRNNLSLALSALQVSDGNDMKSDLTDIKSLLDLVCTSQVSNEIQRWLNAPDATINHNEACAKRHALSGLWLVQGAEYKEWLQEDNSFLWLNGFAGCGKSVLCSTAVQYAFRHRQSNKRVGIAFFYFTFNDSSKQNTSAMLRALLLQLSSQLDSCDDLANLYGRHKSSSPPDPALLECLKQLIQRFRDVYLFFDALDESPKYSARETVLETLAHIRGWRNNIVHLLVTSRDEVDIREAIEPSVVEDISMHNQSVESDIAKFIDDELESRRSLQRWQKYFPDIKEALSAKAKGSFRWVECQFKSLESCPRSKAALDQTLRSLPQSLDGTYERMLLAIESDLEKEYARRILTLLCCSFQPMTLQQVLESTGIELDNDPKVNPELRLEEKRDILSLCPSLISANVEEIRQNYDQKMVGIEYIHIAHYSVQEYLESDRIRQQRVAIFSMKSAAAHEELTQMCLTYLLDDMHSESQLNDDWPPRPVILSLYDYAAKFWHSHYECAKNSSFLTEQLIEKLFISSPSAFACWNRTAKLGFYFNRFSLSYMKVVHENPNPFYYACLMGIRFLVRKMRPDMVSIASLLPHSGEAPITSEYSDDTAFHAASYKGHIEIVQLLLDNGVDVNLSVERAWIGSPLESAARGAQRETIELLLKKGANINAITASLYGSALGTASDLGRRDIVQLLIDNDAEVNLNGGNLGTPITIASISGHKEIIQLLIDNGANVNEEGVADISPLDAACWKGYEEIIQLLINNGADVNGRTRTYGCSLLAASNQGHEQIVRMLIDNGATLEGEGDDNLLRTALDRENWEVAQILLERGATLDPSSYSAAEEKLQEMRDLAPFDDYVKQRMETIEAVFATALMRT